MKDIKKALLYGLLIWAVPFTVAFLIFGIRETNRPLFESIMPVVLTATTVVFTKLYLLKINKNYYKESIKLGILWLAISLFVDLAMFMQGPMKMALTDYVADIGITYLIIPTITIGFGYMLEKEKIALD